MNPLLSKCPVCGGELLVTRLHCRGCDTTIEGHFSPAADRFGALTPEQMEFMLTFIRCEGRLNRMEEELKISYPTLRNRLAEIIRALGFEVSRDEAAPRLTPEDRRRILDDLDQGSITWAEAQRRLRGRKEETIEC